MKRCVAGKDGKGVLYGKSIWGGYPLVSHKTKGSINSGPVPIFDILKNV